MFSNRVIIASVLGIALVYLLFGVGSQPQQHATRSSVVVSTRRAVYSGQYGRDAVASLAEFRSSFLKKILEWQTKHNTSYIDSKKAFMTDNYQPFMPHLHCPPGVKLLKYGKKKGDAPKPICDVSTLRPPCVIYSAGSKNDYTFEEEMLATTRCQVYTFDCTVNGRSIDNSTRHLFFKTCLGVAPEGTTNTFKHLTQIMKELGHKRVDLFKIDIEGFEFDVFQDWRETDQNLPDQIAIELHYHWAKGYDWSHNLPKRKTVDTVSEMAVFYAHMANLGYGVVGHEQNSGGCCAEVGLLRVEAVDSLRAVVKTRKLL